MRRYIFPLLITLCIIASLVPTGYELIRKNDIPSYRSFELVHNYVTDYNFYLSRIRQGYEGRWTVVERYTSEAHEGSFVQILYLFLGKTVRMIPNAIEASAYAYHISRIAFGILFLSLVAWFVQKSFQKPLWQVIAFFLIVTASTWPKFVFMPDASFRFGGYMAWWTLMDSLQRMTFMPHILLGQSLILFLVVAGNDKDTLKKRGNWLFLGFFAFLLGLIFPPGLVFVGASYGISIIVSFALMLRTKKTIRQWGEWGIYEVISRGVIGLVSFPVYLYYTMMFTIYPWKRLVEQDIIRPLPFTFPEYIQALGIMFPLGIVGMIVAFFKKEKVMLVPILWVTTWLLLLFVFQFIPQQSPLRFSEMTPHVPLGILTAYLFFCLGLLKFEMKKTSRIASHIVRVIVYVLLFSVLASGLFHMYSSWLWQRDFVDQKVRAGYPSITMNNYIVYPTRAFVEGLEYIRDMTASNSIILSKNTAGNYIPPYTGRTVYVGHDNTVKREEKMGIVNQFFSGGMSETSAQQFFQNERLSFVFFGPEEQEKNSVTDLSIVYPFLKHVYSNTDVVIYENTQK